METNTARWMRLVFWDMADVEELHRRESLLFARWKEYAEGRTNNRADHLAWDGVMDGMHLEARYQMVPYWDRSIVESIRAERVKEFERQIFKIWAGIMAREKDNKNECEILHLCDLAIIESGNKPMRGPMPNAKKEQAMSKAADVYEP